MFEVGDVSVRSACADDHAALARFCLENPGYDLFLTGEIPQTEAWVEDFMIDLPPKSFNWTATHKLIAVSPDQPDTILAIMDVTEDMIAKGVGHIGLFQVAEALHGAGLAQALYRGLEMWLAGRGSDVIRLGVMEGNQRGRSFWQKHGYQETRTRTGTAPSGKTHLSHVLYKPLKPLTLEAYQARVPRDHPDAP